MTEAPPDGNDGVQWRCTKCGFETTGREIWRYQTGLLLNITEVPDCPPIVRDVLAKCGELLYDISRGKRAAIADAGNAARHAVRVLDQYGYSHSTAHVMGVDAAGTVTATCNGTRSRPTT